MARIIFAPYTMKTNVPDRVFQTHESQGTIDRNPKLRAAQRSWMRATRDYRFYDDVAQEKMMKEHFPDLYPLWARLPLPVMKADVWRYAVVYKYGGIYADADTVYHRPDTSLLRPPSLLTVMPEGGAFEHADGVCNWWFAAPAGSPILGYVLDHVRNLLERAGPVRKQLGSSPYAVHALTGPTVMTNAIRRWAEAGGWRPPRNVRDWEVNKVARKMGLCVYRHLSIYDKVVEHLFAGQWAGGWLEQRRLYAERT